MSKIYPLTITTDRYGGSYSGGQYIAWHLDEYLIPDEANGGDIECMEFWKNFDLPVGRGKTPNKAVKDLKKRLKNTNQVTSNSVLSTTEAIRYLIDGKVLFNVAENNKPVRLIDETITCLFDAGNDWCNNKIENEDRNWGFSDEDYIDWKHFVSEEWRLNPN